MFEALYLLAAGHFVGAGMERRQRKGPLET